MKNEKCFFLWENIRILIITFAVLFALGSFILALE